MSTSAKAEAAAEVFQAHRDELGFVNRAQCEDGDLYTVERDGRIVGAALGNHCVRKPQTTLYELAVLPEYRRQGIATDLIGRLARDSPHDKLVAKCPASLPANEFYDAQGWALIDQEDGKNRALNVWEYQIDASPDLITTGRQDLTEIAADYGWLRGARLDSLGEYEKRDIELDFIDLHWEDPDPEALLAATMRHRPKYVVAGDYGDDNHAQINDRAEQLREYAEHVIIVPHAPGDVERVPEWAVVGYSTPTKYAGTEAPVWEYQGRDVHILGGKPGQIQEIYGYLADSVVSIDCNSFHRGATSFAKWWAKTTPSWNKLPTPTARPENAVRAYENSMLNLSYALREKGIISPGNSGNSLTDSTDTDRSDGGER
jgi:GNAT superfamily N-acetyltransferase